MVKVIATEPVNAFRIGDEFEVSEREAKQLVDKGMVKMLGDVQNKMQAAPANKAVPSKAAGGETQSSSSRAARASVSKTAKKSAAGAKKTTAGK